MTKCPKTVSGNHSFVKEKIEWCDCKSRTVFCGPSITHLQYPECSLCGIIDDRKKKK